VNPFEFAELKRLMQTACGVSNRRMTECAGKDAFDDRVTARAAIKNFADAATIYRCKTCGKLHAGSEEQNRIVKRARRRNLLEKIERAQDGI